MRHLHTARRLTTGLAAGAVLSTTLVAGGTAAAEPERPRAVAPGGDVLILDQLQLLLAPLLSGLGRVGELLSVSQPQWSLPGVSTDIVWLCNGSPIPGTEGLWEYVPTEMQQGCTVAAQVTGTLLGLLPLEYITNALQIPFPGQEEQAPQATTQPTVSGTPKVAQQLTGSDPTWDGDGAVDRSEYQWLRNGAAIPGATQKTYTLSPEDAGKQVAFRVTGTRGSASTIATSSPVLVQPGDAPTATTPVRVSGQGRVGNTLEALDPAWSGSGATSTTFQWLRDGLAIPGATGRSYRVAAEDVGTDLAVRATGTRVGYAPGTSTSTPVSVEPSATATRAVLARKSVARGQRAVLKVIVKVRGGGAAPTGRVQVLEGRQRLKTMTMRASHEGRASITLPRLAPGKHRLKVTYAGSPTLKGSVAKVVVLTVQR